MSPNRSSKSPSYEGSRRPSPCSSNGGRDSSSLEKCPKFYSAEVLTSNTDHCDIIAENNLNIMLSSKKSSPDHFKEILSTIHENGTSEEEKCQEENLPEVLSKDDENQEKFVDEKKEKLKRIVKESEKVKEKEQESANKDAIGDNNSVEVNKQVDEIEGQSERVEVKKEESEEQIVEVTMKLKIEEKVEEKDSTLPPAENPLTKDEIIQLLPTCSWMMVRAALFLVRRRM